MSHDLSPRVRQLLVDADLIAWDFDGVIANTELLQEKSYTELVLRLGISLTGVPFESLVGQPEHDIWPQFAAVGSRSIEELMLARSPIYLNLAESLQPMPFVDAALAYVASSGLGSIVVSNGRYRHIHHLLTLFGLRSAFRALYCRDSPDVSTTIPKLDRHREQSRDLGHRYVVIEDDMRVLHALDDLNVTRLMVRDGNLEVFDDR